MAIEFDRVKLKYEDGFLYDLDGNKMHDEPQYNLSDENTVNGFVAGVSADNKTVYFGIEDSDGDYITPFNIQTSHENADKLVTEYQNKIEQQLKQFEQMIFDLDDGMQL